MLSSCQHHCEIRSIQKDVDIRINKRNYGKTPFVFKSMVNNGTPVFITLSKPGFENLDTFIVKDGGINKFTRILGYIFIIPFYYDQEFKKSYTFKLKENKNDTLSSMKKILISDGKTNSKSQRLIALKEAFQNKVITKEEYVRMKKMIIEGEK